MERTEERLLGAAMHLVYLALVAEKAATVSEALELLTALDVALVRSVMLVHMFAMSSSIKYNVAKFK
jgi:hypothetical protein